MVSKYMVSGCLIGAIVLQVLCARTFASFWNLGPHRKKDPEGEDSDGSAL